MTSDKFVREQLHKLMRSAAKDIGNAVRPIYCATEQGKAEHLGSCVLLKWKGRSLLLTAAHVIDANKVTSLYIPAQKKLRKLEGSGISTTPPGGMRERDKLDFAILELSPDLIQELGEIRFIEGHEIAGTESTRGHAFMAFGYPNSKNKPDHALRRLVPRKFSYGGPASHGDQHLRIKYQKKSKTLEGDIVNSLEPRGSSGGAMFDLGGLLSTSNSSGPHSGFRLAGVLIERKLQEQAIVATKIQTILSVVDRL